MFTPQTAPHVDTNTNSQIVHLHSGRVIVQPERWLGYGESSNILTSNDDVDPLTYGDAMQDKDAKLWDDAMDSEIQSMHDNNAYAL